MVNKNIYIEELVEILPEAINYLSEHNIRCLRCGEPIWGTIEEAAKEKDFSDSEINQIIIDLNSMLKAKKD
jgi:iron-sulfur cluster repair protein YtfE (RIC family)